MKHIEHAYSILEKYVSQYKPTTIICLSSWGHDSQVSTRLVVDWSKKYGHSLNVKVVTLDTGVAADGYTKWVKDQSKASRYNFEIWDNPDVGFGWYQENALEHGFGHTRKHHTEFYYRMLKERTIRKVLQANKKHRHENVVFISGVYRAESSERSNTPEMTKIGSGVYINPLLYWSKEQILQYRIDHKLPTNPFYETVGGSGDCQCNWGPFIDLSTLEKHSPKLAKKISSINDEIVKKHGWGWGEKPSEGLKAERAGQMTLPMIEPLCSPNLCSGCERPKKHQSKYEEAVMLDRMEW